MNTGILNIGNRRELFLDRHLISSLENTGLKLGSPRREENVLDFDQPWEGRFVGSTNIMKDDDCYRLYYRCSGYGKDGNEDVLAEQTCYAESRDGINWVRPELNLHEFEGSTKNNIILPDGDKRRISHNFVAFKDTRAEVPANERYKGVGGTRTHGLFRLVSADGIRWRMFSEEPLFFGYALDTVNVAMWSEHEQCYVAYIRTSTGGGTPEQPKFIGHRTISRSTSPDFVNWSKPVKMDFGATPDEDIYTNGTQPYFRAPHIYIALPFRYVDDQTALTEGEMDAWNFNLDWQRHGASDAILMSSRGGNHYDRTFIESFIRPGLDRGSWTCRSNCPAVGLVQTGETEMSLYLQAHYMLPSYHLRRYSMRLDGFASINAPFAGGEMTTKLLQFTGSKLELNFSGSSVGGIRVEIQDEAGVALKGYALEDCDLVYGDEIARTVTWQKQADVSSLAGQPVKLRFAMKDADLYALQFVD